MPDLRSIESFLRRQIAVIGRLPEEKVTPTSSLEMCGINSMAFVELLITVEKEYGIKLINGGLTGTDLSSITALAARINSELK
ncbi:MAG: acyl carrier protein [Victivallaceae bacterium]